MFSSGLKNFCRLVILSEPRHLSAEKKTGVPRHFTIQNDIDKEFFSKLRDS